MIISITTSSHSNSRPSSIGSNSIEINYGVTYTFSVNDFTTDTVPAYADPEGDQLSYVYISTLPSFGRLIVNQVDVEIGDEISSGDISTGNFTYTPDNLVEDETVVAFSFDIADQGSETVSGLSNGVMTILINELPNGSPTSIDDNAVSASYAETIVFQPLDFQLGYSDPEGDAAYSIKVLDLPSSGQLELDGVAVSVNQEILFTEIAAGYLTHVPDTNVTTAVSYTFNFAISDAGSKEFLT